MATFFYKTDDPSKRKHHLFSAGILPWQKSNSGKIYILLGKDQNGTWSDFGGKCDPEKDMNNIKNTACREFYEETYGSVLSMHATKDMLKNENNYLIINTESFGGISYYMFLLRLPMRPKVVQDRFSRTYNYVKYIDANYQYKEKTDIRWISLETLFIIMNNNEKTARELGWPLKEVFRRTLINNKDKLFELKRFCQ